MIVRKLVSLAVLFVLALPLASLAQGNQYGSRYPAATTKHKKGKAKKAKKAKAGKKAKGAHAKAKKAKSHAPKRESLDAQAGSPVNHTPPEMKEDLPAPSAESTTEH